jgi:5'-3' exonuclease
MGIPALFRWLSDKYPKIMTNVFVERGKNSAYERVQRLGEVDNLGDLLTYGYGFFNVEKRT